MALIKWTDAINNGDTYFLQYVDQIKATPTYASFIRMCTSGPTARLMQAAKLSGNRQ